MKHFLPLFCILIVCSCSTLPKTFTSPNIMKVKQGMSSNEILKIFGNPKNISQSVCGSKTPHPWNCTTWEYGELPYDRATFTFNGKNGTYVLNDFDIDRDGSSKLPESFNTQNIMKIKQGMKSSKILKIFGIPPKVRQQICGSGVGKPWTCTTWGYGKFPYERATFTFSGKSGSYILNDFKIER